MKTLFSLFLGLACLAVSVRAANEATPELTTITTLSGKTFENVKILQAYPDGVAFRHSKGAAQIPFTDLPEDVQKRFQYDPDAAKAYVKEHVEAERVEAEKAALARAERRKQESEAALAAMQVALLREQYAVNSRGYAADGGYADYGVPTWGYGYGGGDFLPSLGESVGWNGSRSRRGHGNISAADALFYNYNTPKYIGPYSALYSGAITNSNVRPSLTFGGYRYPTALAYPADVPNARFTGHRPNTQSGHGSNYQSGGTHAMRPAARQSFVPANTAGARIGGTGGLMRVGSPRISHQ